LPAGSLSSRQGCAADGRRIAKNGPPLSAALARRQDTGRLCRPRCQRPGIAYIYSRENEADALQAKVLTKDEARRIAVNVATLPELLGKGGRDA
jgi:hypothetical protein